MSGHIHSYLWPHAALGPQVGHICFTETEKEGNKEGRGGLRKKIRGKKQAGGAEGGRGGGSWGKGIKGVG